ncbi:MAG: polysaccharide biosynthesis protein [Endozoicomonas sp.]
MLRESLIALPRWRKKLLCLILDTGVLCFSLVLAYSFRVGVIEFWNSYSDQFLWLSLLATTITLPIFVRFGLYRAVVRYMGLQMTFAVVQATILAGLMLTGSILLLQVEQVPRTIIPLYCFFSMLLVTTSRYAAQLWLSGYEVKEIILSPFKPYQGNRHFSQGVPVAIYGAGSAGVQLVEALDRGRRYKPVAFVDDDAALHGRTVSGRRVFHPDHLNSMLSIASPQEVLLAIPSARSGRRRAVMKSLETLGLPVRTMPDLHEIASGKLQIQEIRDVDIGDLLGRETVAPNTDLMSFCISRKVVMVTGAGGSIGSELCRQIIQYKPSRLVLLDHSEFNLYAISEELTRAITNLDLQLELVPILGSVNDPERLLDVMQTYDVDTVYHAAAYKHVPIVEQNISQGIRNNILGTVYAAQAAILAGVERFVLISTDKAVRPANVMGASKRMAELALQALSHTPVMTPYHPERFGQNGNSVPVKTCFSMVRFGNVLGSSGSVIPRFREQISLGGPLTVTHPSITRYFMTIPEASELVIQAGAMGQGGDVFVLDMGTPVKIVDLARRMIKLSGYTERKDDNPDGDIEISFTGLRPGEKLYEELLIGENVSTTEHPKISRALEDSMPWEDYKVAVNALLISIHNHDYHQTRELLMKYVSGFSPSSELVDLLSRLSPPTQRTDSVVTSLRPGDVAASA